MCRDICGFPINAILQCGDQLLFQPPSHSIPIVVMWVRSRPCQVSPIAQPSLKGPFKLEDDTQLLGQNISNGLGANSSTTWRHQSPPNALFVFPLAFLLFYPCSPIFVRLVSAATFLDCNGHHGSEFPVLWSLLCPDWVVHVAWKRQLNNETNGIDVFVKRNSTIQMEISEKAVRTTVWTRNTEAKLSGQGLRSSVRTTETKKKAKLTIHAHQMGTITCHSLIPPTERNYL